MLFLAGGAGSGKGFAVSNFLEGGKFKIRDVDEIKKAVLKLAALKNKYSEIRGLDLRRPKDVEKLHLFVKKKGFKEKSLDLILSQAKAGKMPNLLFDVTMKDKESITDILPSLVNAGYDPRNIHLVWVLTNYEIAVKQNRQRARIVPDDILLSTHEGAANTMYNFIRRGTPKAVNGSVHIILGGKEHTIFWKDPKTGKPYDGKDGRIAVKDFKYLTIKEPGKKMTSEKSLLSQVSKWIMDNIPRSLKTKGIFGSAQKG